MLKAGYAYHGEANMFHVHVHKCTLGLYLISSPLSREADFFESPMILNLPVLPGFLAPPLPPSKLSFPDDENIGSENKSSSLNLPD